MAVFHQIFKCKLQYFRIVFQISNSMIASPTKQTSDFTSFMIVVNSGC